MNCIDRYKDTHEINFFKKKKIFLILRIYNIYKYSFKNKKQKTFLHKKNLKLNIYKTLKNFFDLKKYIGIIILVYVHKFPHILLIRNKIKKKVFCLPGGSIYQKIEDNKLMYNILEKKLSLDSKCCKMFLNLGKWVFPEFDKRIKYPYLPPNRKSIKSELYLYILELENQTKFEVNLNWDLIAVPLFEINENIKKYGSMISKLPTILFSLLSDKNKIVI
nr:pre-mRNA cleavage factor Im 25 kDa subunit 2-like [Cryptomonas curvata]